MLSRMIYVASNDFEIESIGEGIVSGRRRRRGRRSGRRCSRRLWVLLLFSNVLS